MGAAHEPLLEAARLAVTKAAAICRAVQQDMRVGGGSSITKADKSPVTIADLASQAIVAHTLRETLGADPVLLAEEGVELLRDPANAGQKEAAHAALRKQWANASEVAMLDAIDLGGADAPPAGAGFWTLDPIDGTKGFLRGEQYAVCLAYIEGGEPVVAALACPNLSPDFARAFDNPDAHGEMFLSIKGKGVWRAAADDAARRR